MAATPLWGVSCALAWDSRACEGLAGCTDEGLFLPTYHSTCFRVCGQGTGAPSCPLSSLEGEDEKPIFNKWLGSWGRVCTFNGFDLVELCMIGLEDVQRPDTVFLLQSTCIDSRFFQSLMLNKEIHDD